MSRSFEPKLLTVLREGYGREQFLRDLGAGVLVGIVALPLAIAFAIAYPLTVGFTSGIALILASRVAFVCYSGPGCG